MSWLKEYGMWLQKQTRPTHVDVNNKTYAVTEDGCLQEMETFELLQKTGRELAQRRHDAISFPDPLKVTTLGGVMDYIAENPDGFFTPEREAVINIVAPDSVYLYTQQNKVDERALIVMARAIVPDIGFSRIWDTESAIIKLKTQFAETEHRELLLNLISNIADESKNEIKDDGLKQTVTVRVGVGTVEEKEIPNPLILAPFRTFIEVDQPRSYYLARLHRGGGVSLHEASGGEWRIQAIAAIKEWFEEQISEYFDEAFKIHIIA